MFLNNEREWLWVRQRRVYGLWVLAILLAVPAPSVYREWSARRELELTEHAGATEIDVQPMHYPVGRWRLLPSVQLQETLVRFSHILIRHEQPKTLEIPFSIGLWNYSSPSTRSRAEALLIAESVATQAQSQPHRFGEIARRFSEDSSTRSLGGMLGSVSLYQLGGAPRIIDALEAMSPGEVSGIVVSPYGLHILKRHGAPEHMDVSGSRIVIGYDQARWLHEYLSRWDIPSRSRSSALELARKLYAELTINPEAFGRLVDQYSDHREASEGGDFGQWSTHEPTPHHHAVEVLHALDVNGISPPIDSFIGFQIVKRTENRSRREFAMTAVRLFFDADRSMGEDASKERTLARALSLSKALNDDPSLFETLQREYCCLEATDQWSEGRGEHALTSALSQLDVGEISKSPVKVGQGYYIPKRVAAVAAAPSGNVTFEFPQMRPAQR